MKTSKLLTLLIACASGVFAAKTTMSNLTHKMQTELKAGKYFFIDKASHQAFEDITSIDKPEGKSPAARTDQLLKKYHLITTQGTHANPLTEFVMVKAGHLSLNDSYTTNEKKKALQFSLISIFKDAISDPQYLPGWKGLIDTVSTEDLAEVEYGGTKYKINADALIQQEHAQIQIPKPTPKTKTLTQGTLSIADVPAKFDSILTYIQDEEANDEHVLKYQNGEVEKQCTLEQLYTAINKENRATITLDEVTNYITNKE